MTPIAGKKCTGGATLIEVLIALIILCIGLLASGAAFVTSIDALTLNTQNQRAQRLSQDMAEAVNGLSPYTDTMITLPALVDCNAEALCTPDQLFSSLLAAWQKKIRKNLPAGTGRLLFTEQLGLPVASIDVSWEIRSGNRAHYHYVAALRASP